MRLVVVLLLLAVAAAPRVLAQPAPAAPGAEQAYTVFLRSRPVGQELLSVTASAEGWLIRGSNRLGAPMDVTTRLAEIHYDTAWRPTRLLLDTTSHGQQLLLKTTFANGQAVSELSADGRLSNKTDPVAADTIVLPNAFLGSYAALAKRLVGLQPGATLRGYIAPQGEVPLQVDGVFAERIETPKQAIAATRYSLAVTNPTPGGSMTMSVWTDASGALLRVSLPAQAIDLARDDVASAATRTTAFSLPGDEGVRIAGAGFNIGATVTKPANATRALPVAIVIGGIAAIDRDGIVAGVPVLGQLAGALVDAGYLVVRYDRRGVAQSGGRADTATMNDHADDVRAIISWLQRERKDIDRKRILLVGHSEGAWVAMTTATRDDRVSALALVAGAGTTGSELVLEQQRQALSRLQASDADKQAKIDLQRRINDAAIKGKGWEGIPDEARRAADTPSFQSFLAFDPARVMKDIRQPVLIVHGELDTQVAPQNADRLAELARGRNRKVAVDVVKVPGVNHLLVPAKTGDVNEYATLPDRNVSSAVTSAIVTWMARNMG